MRGCSPELLHEINRYHDEPAADPACVPTYSLAKFARQRVTVALTGEGGDELFAGYRHYRLYRQLAALEERVGSVRASAAWLLERSSRWPAGSGRAGCGRASGSRASPRAIARAGSLSVFTDAERRPATPPRRSRSADGNGYRAAEFALLQEAGARGWTASRRSMYVDAKSQLADQLLMKVDKMTMAASLEARCPFLDQRLDRIRRGACRRR